ncbi:probable alpha-methylacyl-coa racemase [Cephalotrichum gorgonifer]|uniref:Probable alpha-methylacyl-coa racemase n=1 Tax=Cephalotrichum gorgonifer TaxID=2041049 RepID=A0AAE8SR22_9PEZI|nr:probable alpha-methylacyl-coa racemase [Cephalotrichum gorgonifer]
MSPPTPPPLTGLRVLEFAGLAPGPFAGMLLADYGASTLRIDRHPAALVPAPDLLSRHKSSIPVNLKSSAGQSLILSLIPHTDILIDPFRPGVLESLNLGPDALTAINPRLIYARLSGFRRDGRYSAMAGHDINYLAVSGVLSLLGRAGDRPAAPWNLLADFAGGGAPLVAGILLALVSRSNTGRGQVVEANMVDGSAYVATFPRYALKTPLGDGARGENVLDGGCPWYDTYRTADGGYMSVGALEPQFFRALIRGLGLEGKGWEEKRGDRGSWADMRRVFTEVFAGKTRTEWEGVFDGTDACCVPVLGHHELETDPSREGDQRAYVELKGTPGLDPVQEGPGGGRGARESWAVRGDVPRRGYTGSVLSPGQGGEELLGAWAGWERGREYDVVDGGFILKEGRPKL